MCLPLLLLSSFFIPLVLTALAYAQPSAPPRMLVIDYAMGYPEENAGVMSVFTEAGFEVDYRQYYPALVQEDAERYDAIVLMGGGVPGMSLQESDLAINFVLRGKVLILAVPSDAATGGSRPSDAGVHDRYMFNRILNRLNVGLYVLAPSIEGGASLTPVAAYELPPGHEIARDTAIHAAGGVLLRAGTRIVAGARAEPLLVEPARVETPPAVAAHDTPQPAEPRVRMTKRQIRIQPSEVLPEEDIDVFLRGDQPLSGRLEYRSHLRPRPVTWTTGRIKGRVVRVGADTLTVRMSGNLWGSDFAVFPVPIAVTTVAFVEREFPEETGADAETGAIIEQIRDTPGRLAVMAVGRAERLNRGFVMVADRQALNTLSMPAPPLSLAAGELPDRTQVSRLLTRVGKYLINLIVDPDGWSPENPYPAARMPGLQTPSFPVNGIEILPALPQRVTVTKNRTRPADLIEAPVVTDHTPPVRGVWEYIPRADTRLDTLLTLVLENHFNFFWTVAPAPGFAAPDSTQLLESARFTRWGQQIADRLAGSPVQWFVGVTMPDGIEGRYTPAVDARGNPVGAPSVFDLDYWENEVAGPARVIARFSRSTPTLKGIINDWDTHAGRTPEPYAFTDVYNDANFRHYLAYAANNGFYQGKAFDAFKKLDRKERFEWLMKSGRLEDYFRMLEERAVLLGRWYRHAVDQENPLLQHGAFMRNLRLTWFHIGFWRGVTERTEQPYTVLSYETRPPWFDRFMRERGLHVRVVPVALLGLVDGQSYSSVFRTALDQGGYCIERGFWLVSDPDNPQDLSAPQRQSVTSAQAVEALRRIHQEDHGEDH